MDNRCWRRPQSGWIIWRLSSRRRAIIRPSTRRPPGERFQINVTETVSRSHLTSPYRKCSIYHCWWAKPPAQQNFHILSNRCSVRNPILGDGFISKPGCHYICRSRRRLCYSSARRVLRCCSTWNSMNPGFLTHLSSKRMPQPTSTCKFWKIDTSGWFRWFPRPFISLSWFGVSAALRVRTMACEGVEYFTPTDHDSFRLSPRPWTSRSWVLAKYCTRIEVTTLEVGHYFAFRYVQTPLSMQVER